MTSTHTLMLGEAPRAVKYRPAAEWAVATLGGQYFRPTGDVLAPFPIQPSARPSPMAGETHSRWGSRDYSLSSASCASGGLWLSPS